MFRYLCAGFLSVAIHFLMFAPLFEQPVMALPLTQQSQSVSVSFVTPVKPAPKKVEPPAPVKPEPVVKAKPEPVVQKKPVQKTQKKRIVKEKTVTKKIKKETPKPVKKVVKQKPVKPTPVVKKQTAKVVEPKKVVKETAAPAPVIQKPQVAAKKTNGLQDKPQLIQKSRFLSKPIPPKYPRSAKRRGVEGTVTYEVWLDEKGKQVKQLLKDSSGAKTLDAAALKAIKKWKFSPHTINGQQVAHRIYIPISFKLD